MRDLQAYVFIYFTLRVNISNRYAEIRNVDLEYALIYTTRNAVGSSEE